MSSLLIKKATPLQPIYQPLFTQHGLQVWVKRDDLNHPVIQGNKWHKLKLNLIDAQRLGKTQLLTFGGAHSNHIAATAVAAFQRGWSSIGIIRGDELASNHQAWSSTLKQAQQQGMTFEFVDRATYRLRHDPGWLTALQQRFQHAYMLPEGGSNALAVDGFESVSTELEQQCPDWTHLLCAVGTGGTLAGFAKYARPEQHVWGVASLKNADYLTGQITEWIGKDHNNWQLLTDFHGGGYGKVTANIEACASAFETQFDMLLDPIYTNKLIAAFYQLIEQQKFAIGSKIILYHSGGLQGRK